MTKEECVKNLIYLVNKYVNDTDIRNNLILLIEDKKERPPAKGVIYKIFEIHEGDFSSKDKSLIDDISFFFG